MTHLAQPARGHTIHSTQHAYIAAVDFIHDDITRPELRNDAIPARRPSVKERHQRRVLLNPLATGDLERP